jgi:glucosamine--fructose-6-phosphate aminotransferase (isomerizing)
MEQEINEELKMVENINYFKNISNKILSQVEGERVIITGSGTSYNASYLFFLNFISRGIFAMVIQASEVPTTLNKELDSTVAILISHSGESYDIIKAAEHFKKMNIKTISITDFKNSSLAKITDLTFEAGAGEENAVAATKSHFAQVLIGLNLNNKSNFDNLKEILTVIINEEKIKQYAKEIRDKVIFLGSGINYPLAMEGSLKMQETSEIITYHFPSREFLHGPIQILNPEWSVLMLSKDNEVKEKIKYYGADIISIGNDRSDDIYIDTQSNESLYLAKLMILQLLSYHKAFQIGKNPDKPTKLNKVVK